MWNLKGFTWFVIPCPIQGCGEEGILVLEVAGVLAWSGKQNPALPSPSLEKASLIPGFWQKIPNPSQSQECGCGSHHSLATFHGRENQFNGSASHFHRSHLRTLPTSLCTFPRAGMIWESSSPCAEPSACPLSWGVGTIPLDLPKGARGSGIPGLQLPASSSMRLTPSPGIAPLGFGKSHLEQLEAGRGFRDAQPFPT